MSSLTRHRGEQKEPGSKPGQTIRLGEQPNYRVSERSERSVPNIFAQREQTNYFASGVRRHTDRNVKRSDT